MDKDLSVEEMILKVSDLRGVYDKDSDITFVCVEDLKTYLDHFFKPILKHDEDKEVVETLSDLLEGLRENLIERDCE